MAWEHIIIFHMSPNNLQLLPWFWWVIYYSRVQYKVLWGKEGLCGAETDAKEASVPHRTGIRWMLSTALECWLYSTYRTIIRNTTGSSTSCQQWVTLVIFFLFISHSGSISAIMLAPRWYGWLLLETGSILFLNGKQTPKLMSYLHFV